MAKPVATPKLQRHHIVYNPEITVGIRGDAHRLLSTIQRTRGSIPQIEWLKELIISIAYEVVRMTGEIQNNGLDLRQPKFKQGRKTRKVKDETEDF
jgi:hypothetical protein